MLGSAFVFFMRKEIPDQLQKTLLGFASGVMVAASVWSLLIPAIEMMTHSSALTAEIHWTSFMYIPFVASFKAEYSFVRLPDV